MRNHVYDEEEICTYSIKDLIAVFLIIGKMNAYVLAHIFFVITVVKSFSKKQEAKTNEQTPGLLDEFAN